MSLRALFGHRTSRSSRHSSGHAALAVVLALGTGSGLALAGSWWWMRSAAPPAPSVMPSESSLTDTVVVYGPQIFDTPNGGPQNHVERFALTLTPGRRYTLRVDNGAPDGSGRVSDGSVVLNGWEVLSSTDLSGGGPGWTRVIEPLTEDTIQVTVDGTAGANLTVSVASTSDASFLVYGLERFYRYNGTPTTDTRTFTISPTVRRIRYHDPQTLALEDYVKRHTAPPSNERRIRRATTILCTSSAPS